MPSRAMRIARSPQSIKGRWPALGTGTEEELPPPGIAVRPVADLEFEEGLVSLASPTSINASSADLVAEVEALGRSLSLVRERVGEIIFGQSGVGEEALSTLLCGGA